MIQEALYTGGSNEKKVATNTNISYYLYCPFCVPEPVLYPKFYYGEWGSPYSTDLGFYELESDSIDVLFLGSSHSYTSFCPQLLYNQHGITSYNLGAGLQTIPLNYYWLKEALRSQSPDIVMLDAYSLNEPYHESMPFEMPEAMIRKSISYMKWSSVKMDAVADICRFYPEQTFSSYLLPLLRFHDRWKSLTEEDFTADEFAGGDGLLGFSMDMVWNSGTYYNGYSVLEPAEPAEYHPVIKTYLDLMTALCKEEGIDLILVLTPSTHTSLSQHFALKEYCDQNDLLFIDLNDEALLNEIHFDFSIDSADSEHPNLAGAEKITTFIGDILAKRSKIAPHKDLYFEQCQIPYERRLREAVFLNSVNPEEYLSHLDTQNYVIFITENLSENTFIPDSMMNGLCSLCGDSLIKVSDIQNLHLVINGDDELYRFFDQGQILQGTFYNGRYRFAIGSGNLCSIIINEQEFVQNKHGIHIVVYDLNQREIIDNICFEENNGFVGTREPKQH